MKRCSSPFEICSYIIYYENVVLIRKMRVSTDL